MDRGDLARRVPQQSSGPELVGQVVAGADDPGTPPSVGATMVESIPGSRLEVIDDAAHIANVAQPEAFNAAVRTHLTGTST